MNALVELGLALVDLVRAELEDAKAGVMRLGVALGIVVAGAAVLILGVRHLLRALTLALVPPLSPAWGECVAGIAAILTAGVFIWLGSRTARR